ncbi:hypothetical protein BD311DRAFT_722829 [Dichomitus squalens]|uniref:Uncharacterized protein n=1 Tax=Dichomitus squalens TaxID=114155 RepID=A0A4Q9ML26_9APHY|nr:hypothetical protein BD311DRAFT_722829 [Dichomitus squalens]
MQREWTDQTRDEWVARRTVSREQVKRKNPRSPRTSSLETERRSVQEAVCNIIANTISWDLQKYPVELYPAPFDGKIYLPLRHMDDEDHSHIAKFKKGENLNLLVYRFYNQRPDLGFEGVNFVSPVAIASTRHEFLGPAPFVAGYQFDAETKTARIEWWDPYIDLKWIGRSTWKVEVYFDEVVGGYVTRPRGDFDQTPDMTQYLGGKS